MLPVLLLLSCVTKSTHELVEVQLDANLLTPTTTVDSLRARS